MAERADSQSDIICNHLRKLWFSPWRYEVPKSKGRNGNPRQNPTGNRKASGSARLEEASRSTAKIVQDAAALLDEELAAGIVAAGKVQKRFRDERRIDPQDFSSALQRFQADAHEVLKLINDRLDEMRSDENFQVVRNLFDRSHDMVDLAVELVNSSAAVATQLANSPIVKKNLGSRGEHRNKG